MQKDNLLQVVEVEVDSWINGYEEFDAGLFNSWEWVESLTNKSTNTIYLDFEKGGEIVAKLAGIIVNAGWIKGKQVYFTSGPAMKNWNSDLFKDCLATLYSFAKKKQFSRILIRPFDQPRHKKVEVKNFITTTGEEFVVYYNETDGKLGFSSNFIRNVKKAQKSGATFHKSKSPEVLSRMFELLDETQKTRIEKYGKVYDPMYMLNLNNNSLIRLLKSGIGVLNYTVLDGQVNSVLFSLEKNKKIYFLLMGSDEVAYKNGLPSLIGYNISTNAMNNGYLYYNLGLIPTVESGGEGLKRYKESQGASIITRHGYYSYYLRFPLFTLNQLMKLSRILPDNIIIKLLRKIYKLVLTLKK